MALEFYTAYLNNLSKTPKERYIDDLDAVTDRQFQNSSSWDTIKEEDSIGAGTYSDLIVRLNKVIDPRTGTKLGDAYRKIIYQDRVSDKFGLYYQYDNRYWIASNPDLIGLPTSSTIILRCNDLLRWYDECGVYKEYPVYIDASDVGFGLNEDEHQVLTDGRIKGLVQFNDDTSKLLEGHEFLLGRENKYAKYRVSFEDDFETNEVLKLKFSRYQINSDVDNLELGIANYAKRPQFSLNILPTNTEISIGNTVQLEYSLLDKDGQKDDERTISWESSDEDIATVDEYGIVMGIANGSASITATMTCNNTVLDSVDFLITDTPSDNIEYILTPSNESITRSDTIEFEAKKLNNGTEVIETFTFEIDSATTASSDDYVFTTLTDTTFSIKNLNEGETVVILVTPDSDVGNAFTRSLNLNGYW